MTAASVHIIFKSIVVAKLVYIRRKLMVGLRDGRQGRLRHINDGANAS